MRLPSLAWHPEGTRHFLQPAGETLAAAHHVLEIHSLSEEQVHQAEELFQGVGQRPAEPQHLDEIGEVVAAVKGDPSSGVRAAETAMSDEAGTIEVGGELAGVNAVEGEPVEVDATGAEQVDGVRRVEVASDIEFAEVELPHVPDPAAGADGGEVAEGVEEGEAELDELHLVDVGLEEGVAQAGREKTVWPPSSVEEAGKLRVEGDVREAIHEGSNDGELVLQVPRPNRAHHQMLPPSSSSSSLRRHLSTRRYNSVERRRVSERSDA